MGARPKNKNAARHGIWSVIAAMRGSRALDGRSIEAIQLKRTMLNLASARGYSTWSELPPGLQIIAKRAAFKDLVCSSLEDTALQNRNEIPESLWNQYLMWSNSLRQDLIVFGLDRTPKDVSIPTIAEIQQRYEGNE